MLFRATALGPAGRTGVASSLPLVSSGGLGRVHGQAWTGVEGFGGRNGGVVSACFHAAGRALALRAWPQA